ncbi:MAG: hypothetical protein WCB05_02435, partial [Candidatus Sulfotelmatobacter sp.]
DVTPVTETRMGLCGHNVSGVRQLQMRVPDTLLLRTGKLALGILASVLVGFIAGGICGAIILSFNVFIGRSQTTGMHFGDWNSAVLWVGSVYGGIFGMLATPIAYVFLFRKIGFQRAFVPALVGTLVGGLLGGVHSPAVAVLLGVLGFFIRVWVSCKRPAWSL